MTLKRADSSVGECASWTRCKWLGGCSPGEGGVGSSQLGSIHEREETAVDYRVKILRGRPMIPGQRTQRQRPQQRKDGGQGTKHIAGERRYILAC